MSVDLGYIWSAKSLQAPVHAQLQRMNDAAKNVSNNFTSRVLQADPRRLPTQGPMAAKAQNALEQAVLSMGRPAPVVGPAVTPPSPAATATLAQPSTQQRAGTNVTQTPVKVTQPGVDTSISTAIPGTPSDGIPKMASVTGWMSPGANFNIR